LQRMIAGDVAAAREPASSHAPLPGLPADPRRPGVRLGQPEPFAADRTEAAREDGF